MTRNNLINFVIELNHFLKDVFRNRGTKLIRTVKGDVFTSFECIVERNDETIDLSLKKIDFLFDLNMMENLLIPRDWTAGCFG